MCIRAVYEIIDKTMDTNGQMLFDTESEINLYLTSLELSDEEVIELYHNHAVCEQYHSEIKTDMDVERLPSGKFDANELVLELTILAYNILRMMGLESHGGRKPRHKVKRRRLRTVISNLVMMSGHIISHARQLIIRLGKSNVWRHTFSEVYTAFADLSL